MVIPGGDSWPATLAKILLKRHVGRLAADLAFSVEVHRHEHGDI